MPMAVSTDAAVSPDVALADVIIIGGGPAGAICGLALRQQALRQLGGDRVGRIVIVERETFPRFKVCGCCLNGAAASVLAAVNAQHLLAELNAQPLGQWRLACRGRQVSASLPTGWALSRGRMDQALLLLAQQRGVEILQPATARIVAATDQGVEVETVQASGATRWRCRAVVLASGLAGGDQQRWLPWKSAPSGPIGVGANFAYCGDAYEPGVIYMGCADGGYAGVVRLENGDLDVAAAIYEPAGSQKNIPLGDRIENIIELSGLPPVAAPPGTHWKGTPRLQRQRIPGRQRILAVGDAAGYVEPFTGEGMAWAMETGRLAAEAIVDSLPTGGNAGERYAASYQRRLTRRKFTCRLVSAALRRPRARTALFTTLVHCPWLARPVIGLLNRRF